MWKEYYVAALLFLNGVWDWKKREVCLPSILVSLAAGLVGAFLVNAVFFPEPDDVFLGFGEIELGRYRLECMVAHNKNYPCVVCPGL